MHKKPYGHIYIITNIQNNKIYVGQTINLKRRISSHFTGKGSGSYIDNIIRKYNKYITWGILGTCNSKQELDEAEKECIAFFESKNKLYGYNLTDGGATGTIGHLLSEETKRKISKTMKGHLISEETRKKIGKAHRGRILSNEHKLKISKAKKGCVSNRKGIKIKLG